jgi:hypothetical protein
MAEPAKRHPLFSSTSLGTNHGLRTYFDAVGRDPRLDAVLVLAN